MAMMLAHQHLILLHYITRFLICQYHSTKKYNILWFIFPNTTIYIVFGTDGTVPKSNRSRVLFQKTGKRKRKLVHLSTGFIVKKALEQMEQKKSHFNSLYMRFDNNIDTHTRLDVRSEYFIR